MDIEPGELKNNAGPKEEETSDSDSGSYEEVKPPAHPFEIKLIIRALFSFFEPKDLKQFRLVSPCWGLEATELLRYLYSSRKTRSIHFNKEPELLTFNETFTEKTILHNSFTFEPSRPLRQNGSEEFPYMHVKMYGEVFKNFVALAGKNMKKLHLSIRNYYGSTIENRLNRFKFMFEPHLEEILFRHFPFLSEINLTDIVYKQGFHFHSDEHRNKCFGKSQLISLRTFRFSIVQTVLDRYSISDEIIRISPNLRQVEPRCENEIENLSKSGLFLKTLRSISRSVNKVETFEIFYNLFTNKDLEQIDSQEFDNLKIKSLSIGQFEIEVTDRYEDLFKAIRDSTPIKNTLESFSFTTRFFNPDDNSQLMNIFCFLPSFCPKLKCVDFEIYHAYDVEGTHFYQTLARDCSHVEEFKSNFLPLQPGQSEIWHNLKTLKFENLTYLWTIEEEFHQCFQFIQTIAPNLEMFKIIVKCEFHENRKTHLLIYPHIVWIGEKWKKLKKFYVSVNEKLNWRKGTTERNLGIESIEDLNDELENFTTRKITTFDFASAIKWKETFLSVDNHEEFLLWLVEKFPKHEVVQPYGLTKNSIGKTAETILEEIYNTVKETKTV